MSKTIKCSDIYKYIKLLSIFAFKYNNSGDDSFRQKLMEFIKILKKLIKKLLTCPDIKSSINISDEEDVLYKLFLDLPVDLPEKKINDLIDTISTSIVSSTEIDGDDTNNDNGDMIILEDKESDLDILGKVLVDLDSRFTIVRLQESNIANLICDILLEFLPGSDCCIVNSGTFR